MTADPHLTEEQSNWHGSISAYVIGLTMSIILTLAAYFAVDWQLFSGNSLFWVILGLGIIQMCVQLLFFLHLAKDYRPAWNVLVFSFMMITALILILGSLWVMNSLNLRVMPRMGEMKTENTAQNKI